MSDREATGSDLVIPGLISLARAVSAADVVAFVCGRTERWGKKGRERVRERRAERERERGGRGEREKEGERDGERHKKNER